MHDVNRKMSPEAIAWFIGLSVEESEAYSHVKSTNTFEDMGMLTRDKGIVITLENGQEFVVTVQER